MPHLPNLVVTMMMAVLALGMATPCAAQIYRPERPFALETGPNVQLSLSLSRASIDALNAEFDDDFRALDAFSGRRGIDRLPTTAQLNGEWKLYGRFYLVNFQHKLE